MPQARRAREAEGLRHFLELRIERAGAFADDDDGVGQLVQRHGADGGGLCQPGPDIGQHDHDQRRQIEQHDKPGIEQPVDEPAPAHDIADRCAETHRQQEGSEDARERDGEIREQRAGLRFLQDRVEDGERTRKASRIGDPGADLPEEDQRRERGEADQRSLL